MGEFLEEFVPKEFVKEELKQIKEAINKERRFKPGLLLRTRLIHGRSI